VLAFLSHSYVYARSERGNHKQYNVDTHISLERTSSSLCTSSLVLTVPVAASSVSKFPVSFFNRSVSLWFRDTVEADCFKEAMSLISFLRSASLSAAYARVSFGKSEECIACLLCFLANGRKVCLQGLDLLLQRWKLDGSDAFLSRIHRHKALQLREFLLPLLKRGFLSLNGIGRVFLDLLLELYTMTDKRWRSCRTLLTARTYFSKTVISLESRPRLQAVHIFFSFPAWRSCS
jgi:hypothetical protein